MKKSRFFLFFFRLAIKKKINMNGLNMLIKKKSARGPFRSAVKKKKKKKSWVNRLMKKLLFFFF